MLTLLLLLLPACVGTADVHLDAMGDHACLLSGGEVSCWRQHGDEGTAPVTIRGVSDAVSLQVDSSGACAVLASGRAQCWSADDSVAADIGLADVVDVVGAPDPVWAARATCAVTGGGTVLCRGDNRHGQLGDGGTVSRDAFAPVFGVGDAVGIDRAVGASFCATLASGGVRCWGAGALGSLGDGITDEHDATTPVVVSVSGVASVHGGLAASCALGADGGVSCWGWRYRGQLGDGRACDRDTDDCVAVEPVVVDAVAGAVALDTGWAGSCALDAAGGATCWGGLGDASTGAPRTIALQQPAVSVGVGNDFACFAGPGGRVECVGD